MAVRMELLGIRMEQYVFVYARMQNCAGGQAADMEPGLYDFVVCNICEESLRQTSVQVYSETDTLGYCFIVVYPRSVDGRDCVSHCVQACEEIQKNIKDITMGRYLWDQSRSDRPLFCKYVLQAGRGSL